MDTSGLGMHPKRCFGISQAGRPHIPKIALRKFRLLQEALNRMTAFQRSFWSMKARHMDCVLFVRAGAFYELFDVRSETQTLQ